MRESVPPVLMSSSQDQEEVRGQGLSISLQNRAHNPPNPTCLQVLSALCPQYFLSPPPSHAFPRLDFRSLLVGLCSLFTHLPASILFHLLHRCLTENLLYDQHCSKHFTNHNSFINSSSRQGQNSSKNKYQITSLLCLKAFANLRHGIKSKFPPAPRPSCSALARLLYPLPTLSSWHSLSKVSFGFTGLSPS